MSSNSVDEHWVPEHMFSIFNKASVKLMFCNNLTNHFSNLNGDAA